MWLCDVLTNYPHPFTTNKNNDMKQATEIFEKHWVKATGKPLDETTKHHMKYAIEAVDEALNTNAVRVKFCPKDTEETFDGTVIDETIYVYVVVPDDNPTGTARWNKKCCVVLR